MGQGSRHLIAPELVGALDLLPQLMLDDDTLPLLRQGMGPGRPQPPLSPVQQGVEREERRIPGPPGAPDVRVLLYRPPGQAADAPVCLHAHGGGYVVGSADINDGMNRSIAAEQGCVVLSVDYRLAPETRWPGAVEDIYAALAWLVREAAELGVDPTRIAVAGESAGGGHAAALALLARDRGEYPLCFQMLDSPMLDDRTGTGERHPYCGEFVWTPETNRFGWRALLGVEPGGEDVPSGAVPARAATLAGLPPTLLTIGALDLFLDETLDYARRLIRGGVPTELHVIPGGFHGYQAGGESTPQVEAVTRYRRDALARAFRR